MADDICITNPDDGRVRGKKLKRNNYFEGKRLGVDDFNAEQTYLIQKIRRLGAFVFGSGVISGLKIVRVEPKKRAVTIGAGSAVDCSGNLLVVLKDRPFHLEREIEAGDYICLEYTEEGRDKVSVTGDKECDEECCFDRIEEDVKVSLYKEPPRCTPSGICDGKKEHSAPDRPAVLLGRYLKNGGIDYSDVVNLHKNSELSKLLCEIAESYVRTVNGRSGDLYLVSSINEAKPDSNGHIELEAGNNIRVDSEDNRLIISSKSGLYLKYLKKIGAKESTVITHGFGSFPSVDLYKRVKAYLDIDKKRPKYEALSRMEFYKMAKDLMMEPDELEKELGAKDFATFMKDYNKEMSFARRKSISPRSRLKTAEALNMYNVTEFSSKIHRAADVEIGKVMRDIYVVQKYFYEKIVGSTEQNMSLKITHTSTNTLRIENLGGEELTVMVILNA